MALSERIYEELNINRLLAVQENLSFYGEHEEAFLERLTSEWNFVFFELNPWSNEFSLKSVFTFSFLHTEKAFLWELKTKQCG